MKKSGVLLALVAGTCVAVQSASAQLVVGNDQTNAELWLVDVAGVVSPRPITLGAPATQQTAWGLAADEVGQMLYWNNGSTLYKAAYDLNNPMVPILVGPTGIAPTGLAYDSVERKLYARASGGFYELDVNTAASTLVFAMTAQDFGGFDYDAATDSFYGTNDSTSVTVIPGRGLYRIAKPISSPTFTLLATYPNRQDTGAADTDIDGLASGGGKLYLVNDTPAQGAYIWNLAGGAFETPMLLPYTGTNGIFSGGAWAPGLFIPPVGADVAVAKVSNPSTLIAPPGGDVTYVVTVRNNGPEGATGVAMSDPIPSGMTFVSADNGAVFSNGVVTADIGPMTSGEVRTYNIVVNTSTLGNYQNTATITSTSTDNNPGNNSATASTLVRPPQADLRVTITDPADCAVGVGGTVNYSVTLDNLGPEGSDNTQLVVTLPAGTTFLQSNPALVPVNGQLTLAMGQVASGGGGTLTIDVQADVAGQLSLDATAGSSTDDPNGANNTANASTMIIGGGPTTANAVGVLTTIASSPNSDVPGLGGAKFATGIILGRPYRSADASRWIMAADTDLATSIDQVLIVGDSSGVHVAVQEGVTSIPTLQATDPAGPPYFPQGSFDAVHGVNDAGQFMFSGLDSRAGTADDGYVIRGDTNGSFSLIVQEAVTEAPPASGGLFFAGTRSGTQIAQNGTAGMIHLIEPLGATLNEFLLRNDGADILSQVGATIPNGQNNGTTYVLDDLDAGSAQLGSCFNADHSSWIASGLLDSPVTTDDKVAILNGTVVVQEGYPLPNSTLAANVSAVHAVRMESDGTWFVRGSNSDGMDWAVRNGQPVAVKGDPITPGNPVLWGDTGFANGFFMMLGGNNGDYVVGGLTTSGETLSDAILVINGERVLASENDPVDLDGNGVFDDGYFIRTFLDDRAFLTDTDLYIVVRLRDAASALCAATDTDRGQALIRVPLGTGPTCDPDVNCDGVPDQDDVACIILAVAGDMSCFCQADPDFNGDGVPDQGDVADVILTVAGAPCP